MSKEGFCKKCKNGRHNMCRGFRNGNRSLRCLCRHKEEAPARTPQLRPEPRAYPMAYMTWGWRG